MSNQPSVFEKFTNQYALSKTLRFELKPDLRTREWMNKHFKYANNKDVQTFLKDQDIEDAYQVLKPVFDKLHEDFITQSLELVAKKGMDFSPYFELVKKQKNEQNKEKKRDFDKPLESEEKRLRESFVSVYSDAGDMFKSKAGKDEKGVDVLKERGFKVLTESGILKYVKDNIDFFAGINLTTRSGKVITIEDLEKALGNEHMEGVFERFFTYFGGFNQNRENYYSVEDKATSVAQRIVGENLPKFCDNILSFEKQRTIYLNIYNFLKDLNKNLKGKNQDGGEIDLYPIAEDIFEVQHFTRCLSQLQIEEYNKVIGNANFLVNLYNQNNNSGLKLPFFKILYKQIGCGENKNLFITINAPDELQAALQKTAQSGQKYFIKSDQEGEIKTVPDFIDYILNKENYLGIYWSDRAINTISSKYFANWFTLRESLRDEKIFPEIGKKGEKEIKIPEAVELEGLFMVINKIENWQEPGVLFKQRCFEENKEGIIEKAKTSSEALLRVIFADITSHMNDFLKQVTVINNLTEFKSEVIKPWLDHSLAINQVLKYFKVKVNKISGESLDSNVQLALDNLVFQQNDNPTSYYDAVRNYLTRKPQSEINKLKLNFENSTLAGGWDVNKESDNSCVILMDGDGRKYLSILTDVGKNVFAKQTGEGKGKNKTTKFNSIFTSDNLGWKKMEYNFWSDVSRMIPKCSVQLNAVQDHFKRSDSDFIFPAGYSVTSGEQFTEDFVITKEQFELNNRIFNKANFAISEMRYNLPELQEKNYIKKWQKEYSNYNSEEYKNALVKWIDFCKNFLSKYPKTKLFTYYFRDSDEYRSVDEFYLDVDSGSYGLNFVDINKQELDMVVEEGKIYLFEIRNQDSNQNKKENHKQNLHTIYWNAIFEQIENKPKLNGNAEIFYRPELPDDKLKKIKDKNGKEIIQNFRFSKEKFIFHCPITLNFCMKGNKLNELINKTIPFHKKVCFLGIDRGEKHLAYYSLVDQKGVVLDHGTLNIPFVDKDGNKRMIKVEKKTIDRNGNEKIEMIECSDYNDLLDARSGDRDYARRNWQTIGTIKELKDGYISQVVRRIVDLSVENNAIIVLENLNVGFKRGRQKIEKQVYQKLELALAKKLNFLVNKSAAYGEVGSVTNALQLTPLVNNFGDIENKQQLGIMLYTRADYTSQTDPVSGWRKSVYLKRGSVESIKKQIISSFDDIYFDGKDYCFEYTVDYLDPLNKKSASPYQKQWHLYSGINGVSLDRFHGERDSVANTWVSTPQDVMRILNGVFGDFDKTTSLLKQLQEGKELKKVDPKRSGWESLRFAVDLIQQIRNTGTSKEDTDFIFSPIRVDGVHFDSRRAEKHQPISGDANGAFNIARKGIVMNEHIKRGYKLLISDFEWDAWLAGRDIWEKWVNDNEKKLIQDKKKQ